MFKQFHMYMLLERSQQVEKIESSLLSELGRFQNTAGVEVEASFIADVCTYNGPSIPDKLYWNRIDFWYFLPSIHDYSVSNCLWQGCSSGVSNIASRGRRASTLFYKISV